MSFKQPTQLLDVRLTNMNISLSKTINETRVFIKELFLKLNTSFKDLIRARRENRDQLIETDFNLKVDKPSKFKSLINKINIEKTIKAVSLLVVLILLIVFVPKLFKVSDAGQSSEKIEVKGASEAISLNRDFSFPIKDDKGETVSDIKYFIENAELRDEIIVKGQKATAVEGRTFLIFNIKINNPYGKAIEINTKDYVRLSINANKDEWLAPDIHNDPVEVQAISVEPTRVGFAINETDKDLVLRVGEINGEKQELPIIF